MFVRSQVFVLNDKDCFLFLGGFFESHPLNWFAFGVVHPSSSITVTFDVPALAPLEEFLSSTEDWLDESLVEFDVGFSAFEVGEEGEAESLRVGRGEGHWSLEAREVNSAIFSLALSK